MAWVSAETFRAFDRGQEDRRLGFADTVGAWRYDPRSPEYGAWFTGWCTPRFVPERELVGVLPETEEVE